MNQKTGLIMGILVMFSLVATVQATDLVQDCTLCGCPAGQVCNIFTRQCEQACSGGTLYGECSPIKPMYCDNGALVDNCQECGCSGGLDCFPNGECRAGPILTATVDSQYTYDRDISITVTTQNVEEYDQVSGRISTDDGILVEEITYGSWFDSNKVKFDFNAIQVPGNYKFLSWTSRATPPQDNIYSPEKFFIIKAPMDTKFTISDPNQYTVQDIKLAVTVLGPLGEIVTFNRQVTAKIDGVTANIGTIGWEDKGNGKWEITIKKEYLRAGTMEVTLIVSDQYDKYETTTEVMSNIHITKPVVSVSVLAPTEAKIGDTKEIRVATNDLFGRAMEPDTIELVVTYPGSLVTKTFYRTAFTNDFSTVSDGVYSIHFQFADSEGGSYSWEASATEAFYFKGSSTGVVTIVSGGGIIVTCDVTEQCDPNCVDDPDCQVPPTIPWWAWILLAIVIVFVLVMVIRRR